MEEIEKNEEVEDKESRAEPSEGTMSARIRRTLREAEESVPSRDIPLEYVNRKQRAKENKSSRGSGSDLPKKKKLAGAILAVIPTVVCVVIVALAANMNKAAFETPKVEPFARNVILIGFGLIVISALLAAFRPRIPKAIGWIVWALFPAGTMLLCEWIIRNPFNGKMTWKVILLNIAIYYITAGFFLFLTRNTFVSVICATVFPLVLAIANHYVHLFRGTVLFPWDLQSLGIAMTVVDNYEFDFPLTLALVVESFVVIWQLSYFSRVKILRSSWKKMAVSFVCAALCLAMGIRYGLYISDGNKAVDDFDLYPYLFTPNSVYNYDGMMVSLLYSLQFMSVDKPEGYSVDKVNELAAAYEKSGDDGENNAKETEKPNIIVIMNEAWSDISVLAPFTTTEEVFPVTSALKDNVARGQMYMSIVGGNTANSEFELLTGSTMAFLPPGSVAYQQFIKHDTPTLVSSLEAQGYQSAAMHPYLAKGWDRDKVYVWFGFDERVFSEDFPKSAERIRSYISDRAMFEMIEKLYEKRDAGKPFFLFGVTMQNHGGYTGHYENFPQDVFVEGLESNPQLSQYLSLIRETDFAFGEMLRYFENVDEPTIIVMFGDHQPGEFVTAPLYSNAGLAYPPEGDAQYDKYIVPLIIWANYDIEERDDLLLSPNYLSALICETAGLELTPYQRFLCDLQKKYPVLTANFFIDADGKFHTNDEMDAIEDFNDYKILQYNQIIDYKNTVGQAFAPKK